MHLLHLSASVGCVIIVYTSVEPIQYSWLNNVQMLPFCSENSGPFQLHYAHVRNDNKPFSLCICIPMWGSLGMRLECVLASSPGLLLGLGY